MQDFANAVDGFELCVTKLKKKISQFAKLQRYDEKCESKLSTNYLWLV